MTGRSVAYSRSMSRQKLYCYIRAFSFSLLCRLPTIDGVSTGKTCHLPQKKFCQLLKPTKVLIASNTAWSIVNFRAGLIRALVDSGCEVVAVASPDEYVNRLPDLGCRHLSLPIDSKGTHPGRDLLLLWRFWRLLRRQRPDVFLGYTIKPNVYGSLAARGLGIPAINNITGLGAAFAKRNWLRLLVCGLYRLALARSAMVFFLNKDDRQAFVEGGMARSEKTDEIPGEGIDLAKFQITPLPACPNRFRFLLIARMLWDKGVGEYVEAARIVKRRFTDADFCLLGPLDVQNPAAVSRGQMDAWVAEGIVRYLGVSDDVREEIKGSDCIMLPSYYREGVPRALLEAAAMGRPIITTDSVGCREVVDEGINGFLCRVRDANDLAKKMEQMLALNYEARSEMGQRGREKVEREFDERIVISRYLEVISKLME